MSITEKQYQILTAAKDVFLKKGIFKTRVEDVTNSLGIAKGSFYTYFKSKNQLLEMIIEDMYKTKQYDLESILMESCNYKEKLKKFIITRFMTSSTNLKSHLILINLTRNLEHLTPKIREYYVKIEVLNRNFLKRLIKLIPNINYSEQDINSLIIFIMGGIKSYRLERFFYKNIDDYFINDISEFKMRLNNLEIDREVELVVRGILKILTGGK